MTKVRIEFNPRALRQHLSEYTPGDWAGWDRDALEALLNQIEAADKMMINAVAMCKLAQCESQDEYDAQSDLLASINGYLEAGYRAMGMEPK